MCSPSPMSAPWLGGLALSKRSSFYVGRDVGDESIFSGRRGGRRASAGAWRRVYGLVADDALTADATAIFRTEDLLLDDVAKQEL